MAPRTNELACNLGALLADADWALAHGNIETFAHASKLLATTTSDSLCANLQAVANLCDLDPGLAVRCWPLLREQVCLELQVSCSCLVYH